MSSSSYTPDKTNAAKGIALLLLLYHHLFYNPDYAHTFFTFGNLDLKLILKTAQFSKVCVSIFLILSGFGISRAADRVQRVGVRFAASRILKLLFGFWFVYALFVPIGFFWGTKHPLQIYGGGFSGVLHFVLDFFGVSGWTKTPTMNATWWFMAYILAFYAIFPLLRSALKKSRVLSACIFVCAAILCVWKANPWLLAFFVGMLFSEYRVLDRLCVPSRTRRILCICGVLTLPLRFLFQVRADVLFAIWILILALAWIPSGSLAEKGLVFLGKHSFSVFLFHTFLYSHFFRAPLYSLKYPPLIFLVLLAACLIVSVCINYLKKYTGYERLQRKLICLTEGRSHS